MSDTIIGNRRALAAMRIIEGRRVVDCHQSLKGTINLDCGPIHLKHSKWLPKRRRGNTVVVHRGRFMRWGRWGLFLLSARWRVSRQGQLLIHSGSPYRCIDAFVDRVVGQRIAKMTQQGRWVRVLFTNGWVLDILDGDWDFSIATSFQHCRYEFTESASNG